MHKDWFEDDNEIRLLHRGKRRLLDIVFGRTMVITLLLVLQIAIMVLGAHYLGRYYPALTIVLRVMSVAVIIYLVNKSGSATTKITWIILVMALPAFGVQTTFVNAHDLAEVEAAIQDNTRAVYIETLGNPNADIPDIDAIAAIAHKHSIPLVIDNTFGTPYLIRPIEHGADIVVHSATKFIGGHGTSLGGIIVDSGKFDWKASGKFPAFSEPNPSYHGVCFAEAAGPAAFVTYVRAVILRDLGGCISPFNAWVLLQGTETLSLRLDRHNENTKKVVEFLTHHPKVEKVNHPSLPDHPDHALYEKYFPNGGASIFTFNIKGGREEAFKFIDNLKIFSLLANVADVKSLVIHPASTTHSQLNDEELAEQQIYQNTIRLSIGTEHIDDIIADLEAGFAAVRGE